MSAVRVRSIPLTGGRKILCIRLEAEDRINALRLETSLAIGEAVLRGEADGDVVLIWLEGAGKRGFCAGGDVRAISSVWQEGGKEEALAFFTAEYRMDYAIHTAKTPILCFAHGIVMGGGIGLLAGCRHKVLTPDVVLAMPEISIGFFPDVGATWFLNRMPRGCGRLIGLTGYRMDAADACFVGLGDRVVREEDRTAIFDTLLTLDWTGKPERDAQMVDAVLSHFALPVEAGFLAEKPECLRNFAQAPDPETFSAVLETAGRREPRLARAARNVAQGSPFSIQLVWRQMQEGRHLSLRQAFCLELILAARVLEHPDFHEGVRALLADRDMRPVWKDAHLDAVDPQRIAHCFISPWNQQHPLQDLPDPALTAGWS